MKEIFSDSNIILWHESGVNKTKQKNKTKNKKKQLIFKISVDKNFTFTSSAWLYSVSLLHRLAWHDKWSLVNNNLC